MYDGERDWEAIERERDRLPHPITQETRGLLRCVNLLKFYEEATSLRGNFAFLQQLIRRWDHVEQAFMVSIDLWYRPMEQDIYFITWLFKRGEDWTQFPKLPIGVATNM